MQRLPPELDGLEGGGMRCVFQDRRTPIHLAQQLCATVELLGQAGNVLMAMMTITVLAHGLRKIKPIIAVEKVMGAKIGRAHV